jgi:hypothetical protein
MLDKNGTGAGSAFGLESSAQWWASRARTGFFTLDCEVEDGLGRGNLLGTSFAR